LDEILEEVIAENEHTDTEQQRTKKLEKQKQDRERDGDGLRKLGTVREAEHEQESTFNKDETFKPKQWQDLPGDRSQEADANLMFSVDSRRNPFLASQEGPDEGGGRNQA
jgi:hypothetical protein